MRRLVRNPLVWLPVSLLLLAFVAWRSRIWEAGAVLGAPAPLPLGAAVLLNLPVVLLWAVRSADLLGGTGHPVRMRAMVPLGAFANTVNNLTPGSTGEVARAWILRAQHGVPYATGTAVILIERLVAIGYMAGTALVAWIGHRLGVPAPVQGMLMISVLALPGIIYAGGLRPASWLGRAVLWLVPGEARQVQVRGGLSNVDARMRDLLTTPRRLAVLAASTAAIFVCYALQVVLVAASVGVEIGLDVAWAALGLATVAGVISMLPFGLGATDLVLATLLVGMGVPATAAGAIAFGYRLVATLPLGILGGLSYAWLASRLPAGGPQRMLDDLTADVAVHPGRDG